MPRLRQIEATRAIPVIMVTTRGGDDMENGYEVGCNDYVTTHSRTRAAVEGPQSDRRVGEERRMSSPRSTCRACRRRTSGFGRSWTA